MIAFVKITVLASIVHSAIAAVDPRQYLDPEDAKRAIAEERKPRKTITETLSGGDVLQWSLNYDQAGNRFIFSRARESRGVKTENRITIDPLFLFRLLTLIDLANEWEKRATDSHSLPFDAKIADINGCEWRFHWAGDRYFLRSDSELLSKKDAENFRVLIVSALPKQRL